MYRRHPDISRARPPGPQLPPSTRSEPGDPMLSDLTTQDARSRGFDPCCQTFKKPLGLESAPSIKAGGIDLYHQRSLVVESSPVRCPIIPRSPNRFDGQLQNISSDPRLLALFQQYSRISAIRDRPESLSKTRVFANAGGLSGAVHDS